MLLFKIKYHIIAVFQKIVLKLIYRKQISFGKKTTWRSSFKVMIYKNACVNIGNGCFFNNYCSLNSNLNITIGNNVIFGESVKIYDHDHVFKKSSVLIKNQGYKAMKVEIGDNCWICSNVTILKGTRIGKKCVIGAGTVLSGNIPDNSIVKSNRSLKVEKIRDEI